MNLEGLIDGVASSRRYFLKHLNSMPENAWTFKPYPECKNVLETLVHLRIDDLMAEESIVTLLEPDYAAATIGAYEKVEKGPEYLLDLLAESHASLLNLIRSRFSESSLDEDICVWGAMMPLYRGVPYLSSEDFYHAGQVAFIRMAMEPGWDYYASIYGQ